MPVSVFSSKAVMSCLWIIFHLVQFTVQSVPSSQSGEEFNGNSDLVFEASSTEERIVRDIIFLQNGVHVDFTYNETASSSSEFEGMASSPGCPKSVDGRPWLYYGSPPMCYLVGFPGPCPWGQRFFSVNNSKYGVCNCDCFAQKVVGEEQRLPMSSKKDVIEKNIYLPRRTSRSRVVTTLALPTGLKKAYQIRSEPVTSSDRYQFCYSSSFRRQVVYDRVRQECYPFLEQGPCPKGEWLVRDLQKQNAVECEKRKCPEFTLYSKAHLEGPGGFTYFDYRNQECHTELYVPLESFYANAPVTTRSQFCHEAGMKYSTKLRSCIKNSQTKFHYKILG